MQLGRRRIAAVAAALALLAGALLVLRPWQLDPALGPAQVIRFNEQDLAQVPAALAAGRPVRIEVYDSTTATAPTKVREIEGRPLTANERRRVARLLEYGQRAGHATMEHLLAKQPPATPLELEQALRFQHMNEVKLRLLEEGKAFVSDSVFQTADGIAYGNNVALDDEGKQIFVHFPIDLERFPQVAKSLEMVELLKGLEEEQSNLGWNSKPIEERRTLLEAAERDRKEVQALQKQISDLYLAQPKGTDARAVPGIQELQARVSELTQRHRGVPLFYNPRTWDAVARPKRRW